MPGTSHEPTSYNGNQREAMNKVANDNIWSQFRKGLSASLIGGGVTGTFAGLTMAAFNAASNPPPEFVQALTIDLDVAKIAFCAGTALTAIFVGQMGSKRKDDTTVSLEFREPGKQLHVSLGTGSFKSTGARTARLCATVAAFAALAIPTAPIADGITALREHFAMAGSSASADSLQTNTAIAAALHVQPAPVNA